MRSTPSLLSVLLLACACAGPTPREVLNDYKRALQKGEHRTVHELSDASVRTAYTPDQLQEKATPKAVQSLVERLGSIVGVRQTAQIELSDGGRVVLVKEEGRWRVLEGGLLMDRYDTPEYSIDTFLRASAEGRLDAVRAAIPESFSKIYQSDEALAAHLLHISPRIEQARKTIGRLAPGTAQLKEQDGQKRATLVYGEGKAVRLIFEAGRWRILDLE